MATHNTCRINNDPSPKQVCLSQYPVQKQLQGEDNYGVMCKTILKFTQDSNMLVGETHNTRKAPREINI